MTQRDDGCKQGQVEQEQGAVEGERAVEQEIDALDRIAQRTPYRLDDAARRKDQVRLYGLSAQQARAHRQQVALGYGGYWCVALPSDPIHAVFERHAQDGAEALERALRQYEQDTGRPVIGLEPRAGGGHRDL